MKKMFAKFTGKKTLSYDDKGIVVKKSSESEMIVNWQSINKVVFVNYFEEYSGYFLTDDYKLKTLYNDISVDCNRNIVKIRTGGAPTVNKNTSKPFSKKYGTTSINDVVFVEYKDVKGAKNLYALHYENVNKSAEALRNYLDENKVLQESKIEGFSYIAEL